MQGELEITTLAGTGKGKAAGAAEDVVERLPFLLLSLDLPAAPLFKDVLEKNIIPQVPIFNIMRKFDGESIHDDIKVRACVRLPTRMHARVAHGHAERKARMPLIRLFRPCIWGQACSMQCWAQPSLCERGRSMSANIGAAGSTLCNVHLRRVA